MDRRDPPSGWALAAVVAVGLGAAPTAALVSTAGAWEPLTAFVVATAVANGLFLLAFVVWILDPARRAHVPTLRPAWYDLVRTLVLCLASFVAAATVLLVASAVGVDPSGEGVHLLPPTSAATVAIAVARYAVGPVAEELFFRGALLGGLAARIGGRAVAVQALVFGLAHLRSLSPPDVGTAVSATVVGLVLGLGVHRYRRLIPAVAAHALVNAL